MIYKTKSFINKLLVPLGLGNPALGVKISQEEKAKMLLRYKKPEQKVFVETGTRDGDMIDMIGGEFDRIFSVELDKELYKKAVKRFEGRNNIRLLEGDSANEIHKILAGLHEPALFWLDAHGDTVEIDGPNAAPLKAELEAIFAHNVKGHTILIDDARHVDIRGISVIKNLAKQSDFLCKIERGLFILNENKR